MIINHHSRKQRQLKNLVKHFNTLLKITDVDVKSEINKAVAKIKYLVSQLSSIMSAIRMKRILGTVALFIGLSFTNTTSAQYFAYPISNPFGITPGYTNFVQSVNLVDIDNDGDLDLFTDSMITGYYSAVTTFSYQENIGNTTTPDFNTSQVSPFNLNPITNDSSAAKMRHFIDLDHDGDFDVFSNVVYQDYSFISRYRYYENIGTASSPNFAQAVVNPFGLQDSQGYIEFSSIGDIDNDGDYDLINAQSGYSGGSFNFIKNIGSNTVPLFGVPQGNTFNLPNTVGTINPTLKDIDSDGDLDLIYAEEAYNGGTFKYCENAGTNTAAQFALPSINPFGLNASIFDSSPRLEFKDLDGDNDLDLLAGTYEETSYYENVGVQQPPVTYECINYSCVDPGDGSGDYTTYTDCMYDCAPEPTWNCDVTLGCIDPADETGLYASLSGCQEDCNVTSVENTKVEDLILYPNPVNNTLNINSEKKIRKIEIFDNLGRVIYTESNPSSIINVEPFEAGLYSIAISFNNNRIIKKFTK